MFPYTGLLQLQETIWDCDDKTESLPASYRLWDVGQTERHRLELLHAGHEAAVPGSGAADELGQAHGAVVAGHVEALLQALPQSHLPPHSSPSQRRADRTALLAQSQALSPAAGPSLGPPG